MHRRSYWVVLGLDDLNAKVNKIFYDNDAGRNALMRVHWYICFPLKIFPAQLKYVDDIS